MDKNKMILKVVFDLLKQYGYKGTTLDEVSRQAQVGKPTLYKLYGSKKKLCYEAIFTYSISSDSITVTDQLSYDQLCSDLVLLFQEYLALYIEQSSVYRMMMTSYFYDTDLNQKNYQKVATTTRHLEMYLNKMKDLQRIKDVDISAIAEIVFSTLFKQGLELSAKNKPVSRQKRIAEVTPIARFISELLAI